jgi:hypothetical protein
MTHRWEGWGFGASPQGASAQRALMKEPLLGFVLSHPGEAGIHPTDEDLSVGTPGMGRPIFMVDEDSERPLRSR